MTYENEELDGRFAEMTLGEFHRTFPTACHEALRMFLPIMSRAIELQREGPEKWGVAFALGLSICAGQSMSDVATRLGCSRALLSYKAREFCEAFNLPPSSYMKSDKAVEVATAARNRVCQESVSRGTKGKQSGIAKRLSGVNSTKRKKPVKHQKQKTK